MNHLHQLLEDCASGRLTAGAASLVAPHRELQGGFDPPSIEEAVTARRDLVSFADQAVCFDVGELGLITQLQVIGCLVRLPYPVCWFEATTSDHGIVGSFCFQAMTSEQACVHGCTFVRHQAGWVYVGRWSMMQWDERGLPVVAEAIPNSARWHAVADYPRYVACFLSALNCTNVRQIEEKPAAALQKARSRRGKQPIYSTWTLELDLTQRSATSEHGGTHASPRVHLRRGHARQYAPGKFTWVQPHVVGDPARGMVDKDYAVRGGGSQRQHAAVGAAWWG